MLSPEEQLQVREVITRVERRVTSELRLRTTPQQAVDFIEVLHSNLDNVVRLANSPDMALECKERGEAKTILFNLCGHGHFDMQAYLDYFAGKLQDIDYNESDLQQSLAHLPKMAAE